MPCYLTPKQDDYNKIPELQVCIAEALYDVESIVADPGAYTREELAALRSQILSNLEQAWELLVRWWDPIVIARSPLLPRRVHLKARQHRFGWHHTVSTYQVDYIAQVSCGS